MKITHDMLNKYGYTEGCAGRSFKLAGFREARNRNTECRSRTEKTAQQDEVDKARWEKNEKRMNRRIPEQMERTLGGQKMNQEKGNDERKEEEQEMKTASGSDAENEQKAQEQNPCA